MVRLFAYIILLMTLVAVLISARDRTQITYQSQSEPLKTYKEEIHLYASMPKKSEPEQRILGVTMELKKDFTLKDYANYVKMDTDQETIRKTLWFVNNYIEYEFNWYSRGTKTVLQDWKGDCTDKAELMVKLLELNNIEARTAHGWVEIDGELVKHDFVEVKTESDWKIIDNLEIEKREGIEIW